MRFNFRGIGKSQGQFDHGIGELSDAASALDYLQLHVPNARSCWVAGFSFGAWIAMQLLMRRPEVKGFIAVSPPAKTYDFNFSTMPLVRNVNKWNPRQVVQPDDVLELANKLKQQKGIEITHQEVEGANHFFEPGMDKMLSNVEDYKRQEQATNLRKSNGIFAKK